MYLREDLQELWHGADPLDEAFALEGETYRDVAGRRTLRVELGGKAYFVKLHYGVGWGEIFKNLLQFKKPIIGATNEYLACRDLAHVGIPAPEVAAFAEGSGSIASRRSFVLCDALDGFESLEDVTERWFDQAPTLSDRRALLRAVAEFAREFHEQGFVHRDFYICHLLLDQAAFADGKVRLAVLDLHRARRFKALPKSWRRRDMAALLFSTLDLGFTERDWLRFLKTYSDRPLREVLRDDGDFWQSVLQRSERLYAEGVRKGIVRGLYKKGLDGKDLANKAPKDGGAP